MSPSTKKAYFQLHIAVLLFGFTAILGDLIQLQELMLVWWRLFFTCLSLLFFRKVIKELRILPRKTILQLMGIGIVVALHWLTFFGAVKYANASICLICMATASFSVSLLEPLILKRPFRWYEMLLGLAIVPGMVLIVSYTPSDKWFGILLGLISAFLAALFSIFNKKMVDEKKAEVMTMTFVELGSGMIFLTCIAPLYFYFLGDMQLYPNSSSDLIYLLVLALLCTTLAYVLAFESLKHLSAFASTLSVNLEPVYGIILAWFILQEHQELEPNFYLGVGIILLSVFSYPFIKRRFEKNPS